MLANQVIQKIIQDIGTITELECSVWSISGDCLAMTAQKARELGQAVKLFAEHAGEQEEEELLQEGFGLFLAPKEEPAYVLALAGSGADIAMAGRLGVSQLTNLIGAYKEKLDRNRFIQNLILDNMLKVDIYNQARKMKIPMEQRRVVYLVEPKNAENNLILETLKGLYAAGTKDFVTAVGEGRVIVVKALEPTEGCTEIQHTARVLVDTLNMEAMIDIRISFGTVGEDLADISRSYREAQIALEVGRVFYAERKILDYSGLGIGRLIHQLPEELCDIFLKEVFAGNAVESFEDEELAAVYTFFEHNLNISETARRLFVHRNTLVYRLEKIQKKTGLDVRVFDDAMTFKIAMMVERQMRHLRKIDF